MVKISAPGRTEVGGNHTDHQNGNVLAAAVNLDVRLEAEAQIGNIVTVQTDKFGVVEVNLDSLEPQDSDSSSQSLIRGVAGFLQKQGYQIAGFKGTLQSDVLVGSGLSSSAAFENAVAGAFSHLFNDGKIDLVHIARAGQFAENNYLKKGSGLMDQTASAFGGFVQIDFADPTKPIIDPISFDFAAQGFELCITDTKGSHAGLDTAYSLMPMEMKAVANYFNKSVLSEVDESEFYAKMPDIRAQLTSRPQFNGVEISPDRALLRAGHFFAETKRAKLEANALKDNNFTDFLALVRQSGVSSLSYLQNVWNTPSEQSLCLGLLLSQKVLQSSSLEPRGAWRVHGGGLAGTIQAFVPQDLVADYRANLDNLFGEGSCQRLQIRRLGVVRVD